MYQDLAYQAALKYGIDPNIYLKQIGAESGFNPNAVSPAGAVGLGQLMPGTAKRFGVKDPRNPAQNLEGSAKYMRFLLDKFGGNYTKALAGYNAGEGAVDKYGGVPPYKETQNYVSKILGQRPPLGQQQLAPQIPPATQQLPQEAPPIPLGGQPQMGNPLAGMQGLLGQQAPSLGIGDALMMLGKPELAPVIMNNQRIRETNNLSLMSRLIGANSKSDLTATQKNLVSMGLQPGTPEYNQMMYQMLLKPQTTVNMQSGQIPQPNIPGFQGWADPKQGTYYSQAPGEPVEIKTVAGAPSNRPTKAEAERTGKAAVLSTDLTNLDDLISNKGVDLTGLKGKWAQYVNSPDLENIIARKGAEAFGVTSGTTPNEQKALGLTATVRNRVINALSGAATSEQEAQRIMAELPMPGQQKETFKYNIDRTKENLRYLEQVAAERRGQTTPEQFQQPAGDQQAGAGTVNWTDLSNAPQAQPVDRQQRTVNWGDLK